MHHTKQTYVPLFFFRPPPHAVPSLPPAPFLPLPASACRHLPTRALRICISYPIRLDVHCLTSYMNLRSVYSARVAATSTTCSRLRAHTAILARGATGPRTRKGTVRSAQQLGTVLRPARHLKLRDAPASAAQYLCQDATLPALVSPRKQRHARASHAAQYPFQDATLPALVSPRKQRHARVLRARRHTTVLRPAKLPKLRDVQASAVQPPSLDATPLRLGKRRKQRHARVSRALVAATAHSPARLPTTTAKVAATPAASAP